MRKIKTGDQVVIIAGKDKGKTGKVKAVLIKDDDIKVIVEGANLVTKHIKADPAKNISGGIVKREKGMHISNVVILNHVTNRPDRVRFLYLDNKKVRVYASSNEQIPEAK